MSNWNLTFDEIKDKTIFFKVGMPTVHNHIKKEYDKIINNDNRNRIKYGDFYEIYYFILREQIISIKKELKDIKNKIREELQEIEEIQDEIINELKKIKNNVIIMNGEIVNELEIIVNNLIVEEIIPIKNDINYLINNNINNELF